MGAMPGLQEIVAAFVGKDVGLRQDDGMFPDYSWVPVGASWKTNVTGRFSKVGKPWNKAKNS